MPLKTTPKRVSTAPRPRTSQFFFIGFLSSIFMAHRLLGHAYVRVSRYTEALNHLNRALDMPDNMSRDRVRVMSRIAGHVSIVLVVQASHGQVDRSSRHPARLIGSHEDRHVSHLLERHKPSRVGPACEHFLPLFPGHSRCLGARLEGFLDRGCLRHGLWSQTDHANALRGEFGG